MLNNVHGIVHSQIVGFNNPPGINIVGGICIQVVLLFELIYRYNSYSYHEFPSQVVHSSDFLVMSR